MLKKCNILKFIPYLGRAPKFICRSSKYWISKKCSVSKFIPYLVYTSKSISRIYNEKLFFYLSPHKKELKVQSSSNQQHPSTTRRFKLILKLVVTTQFKPIPLSLFSLLPRFLPLPGSLPFSYLYLHLNLYPTITFTFPSPYI